MDGTLHYTTFSGGTIVENFKQYLKDILLPQLNSNSVLVMDNMKSHHAKAVKDLLDSSGVRYIYLPPYSPDLNPIEKLWSKVKAFLRKFKARTLDALPNAIQHAFQTVLPSGCSGGAVLAAIRFIFENCHNLKQKTEVVKPFLAFTSVILFGGCATAPFWCARGDSDSPSFTAP